MQRGFGIIGLLFGLLILIILITSAMSISVNQLKTRNESGQPYYKEKTQEVEEMYERSREMQRRQMEEYENNSEENRGNYDEENGQGFVQDENSDLKPRKKHSRLKGKREFAEEKPQEVEIKSEQEQSYEENHAQEHDIKELSPEKKEQFLEIIEKDFRDSGNMVELK